MLHMENQVLKNQPPEFEHPHAESIAKRPSTLVYSCLFKKKILYNPIVNL
jgi:hypothetical protein